MPDIDLEVEISRQSGSTYNTSCRLDYRNNNALPVATRDTATFNFQELNRLIDERRLTEYGHVLVTTLFAGAERNVEREYERAYELAQGDSCIRLRLMIDDDCPELHNCLWETMADPLSTGNELISTSPKIYFSRVLRHGKPHQFVLRDRSRVRALVMIADPIAKGSDQWTDKIDVNLERERALAAVGGLNPIILASVPETPGNASLMTLTRELESNSYDLLYIVCHGTYNELIPDTVLRFEGADGHVDFVTGNAFVTTFERLSNPPTIVILCSCDTAGPGAQRSESLLAALGPRLAQAGVPAVIAMQGKLATDTARLFFPKLFGELLNEGVVDRAMALARAEIREQPDFYVPVLYHRLRAGRIWYAGDEPVESADSINWRALITSLHEGRSAIILGSALLDSYLGSQAELATQLAHQSSYAFSDSERDDLAMVGQFVENVLGRDNLETLVLRENLRQLMRERRADLPELQGANRRDEILASQTPHLELKRLLQIIWRQYGGKDPYSLIAELPFRAYLSTNCDTLLENALSNADYRLSSGSVVKKKPKIWRCGLAVPTTVTEERFDSSGQAQPTPAEPLLAYLYGEPRPTQRNGDHGEGFLSAAD